MFCRISKMFPQYCSKNFNQLEPIYCKISLRLCLGYPMTIWRYIRKRTKCNIILFTNVIVLFYLILIYFTIFLLTMKTDVWKTVVYVGMGEMILHEGKQMKTHNWSGNRTHAPVSLARCSTTNPPRTNLLVVRSHIYRSCHQWLYI